MLEIYDLKTEYRKEPIGIDAECPRFSWKLKSEKNDVMQTSFRVIVTADGLCLWDSGVIYSAESRFVRYAGLPLKKGQKVFWKVYVTTQEESAESQETYFETALLAPEDWRAKWIQPEDEIDYDELKPAALLRRSFRVKPGLKRGRISQSAHGLYDFRINGKAATQDKFNPGFTSYYYRIQYQTYDITELLKEGENVWAVQLGDGWWRGYTGGGNHNNFGFYTAFIGQILLEYMDGTSESIGSDERFRVKTGPILRCDMKVGEIYDARLAETDWMNPGYDDSSWKNALPAREYADTATLVPSRSVSVTEHEHLEGHPFRDQAGNLVVDFGQNHAGYVRMILRNTRPGQRVVLRYGEGLKDGVFSTANLEETSKDPFQEVVYICKGGAEECYQPTFSIFGYRYVLVENYEGEIRPGDFKGIAVYSDLEETGDFSCSNPLINQLVKNSRWSQKSNFLDAPTDCPTRERSTWSGDSQVFCKTATDFMYVYPFFEKWMKDVELEQFESGCVGNTIPSTNALHNAEERNRMIEAGRFVFAPPTMAGPEGPGSFMDGSAGWGDMAVIIPWTLYQAYGDPTILEQQYESARKWVEFCRKNAQDHNPLYENQPEYHMTTDGVLDADYLYDTHFHWGEWLEPDAAENAGSQSFDPMEFARRGNPLVATAYLYYSSTLLSRMAEVLGKTADRENYATYAEQVRRTYNRYLIQEDGTILADRQAPYVRTLAFGLADEEKQPMVEQKLAEAVKKANFTVNTGFLSTPLLLNMLADHGYPEYAFQMLEQTAFPSWLHPVTMGATTILENWNGLDVFSGSFNHYSYGAVCDFLFSYVAGIRGDEAAPGYQHFFLKPLVGGTLTNASAVLECPYGTIRSAWKRENGVTRYQFTIPANTTATVLLPGREPFELGSGCYHF